MQVKELDKSLLEALTNTSTSPGPSSQRRGKTVPDAVLSSLTLLRLYLHSYQRVFPFTDFYLV